MVTYTLPKAAFGYEAGTPLIDVTIGQARAMECNRCGACCNGLADNVRRDEATGLPLFTWGSRYPADRYASRYGDALLLPVVRGDGGPVIGEDFERDSEGRPYTAFVCSRLQVLHDGDGEGPRTACNLYNGANPADLATLRPRNCGEFPVFGLDVDAAIIDGHPFVAPTGALPECTWHGIRVVGPWKDTPYWRERWERQQRGEPVDPVPAVSDLAPEIVAALHARRATIDGSVRKGMT